MLSDAPSGSGAYTRIPLCTESVYQGICDLLEQERGSLYPEVIYCEGTRDGVYVEVAMQHNDSYNDATYGFVNNIITPEGGTHLAGFMNTLTKALPATYCACRRILKDTEPALTGRRYPRGTHGDHQHQDRGAAVRGTDEAEARQQRGARRR